jgi:hypothetical protein
MFARWYCVGVLLALVAVSCADSMDGPMDGHGLSLPGRSLSEGTVGASYRELISAGGDAAGRARWQLSAGALPPGLSLTSMAGPTG